MNSECGQFSKLSNLLRHINKFHNDLNGNVTFGLASGNQASPGIPPEPSSHWHSYEVQCQSYPSVCDDKSVENEATALVENLRAKSGVSHSLIPEIIVVPACVKLSSYLDGSKGIATCEVMDTAALAKVEAVLQSCISETASKLDSLQTRQVLSVASFVCHACGG